MIKKVFLLVMILSLMFSVSVVAQTHTLRVYWNPVQDADPLTYKVYMSTDDGDFVFQTQTQEDITEAFIPDLPHEHKYCFGVSAVDPAGNESAMSTEKACMDYALPGVPSGIGCEEVQ